jgi:hypothetical protein
VHSGKLTRKIYTQGERVLRIEVIVHHTQELAGYRGKSFSTWHPPMEQDRTPSALIPQQELAGPTAHQSKDNRKPLCRNKEEEGLKVHAEIDDARYPAGVKGSRLGNGRDPRPPS